MEGQLSCSDCTDNYFKKAEDVSGHNMPAVTCLFTNAQSVMNKLPELQAVVRDHVPKLLD